MSKPVILVLGYGNVTKPLIDYLLKYKDQVRIRLGTRDPSKLTHLQEQGVELYPFDYSLSDTYEAPIRGADRMMLAPPGIENRGEVTAEIVKVAQRHGVKFIVLIAGPAVDSSDILFSRQFRIPEKAIIETKIPYSFLRCMYFQENFLWVKDSIAKGEIFLPTGEGKIPLISVKDIAAVALEILLNPEKHEFKKYELTGPRALSGDEIAKELSDAIGKEVKFHNLSDEDAVKYFVKSGLPEWQAKGVVEMMQQFRNGVKEFVTPTNDVKTVTGREPQDFRVIAQQIASILKQQT